VAAAGLRAGRGLAVVGAVVLLGAAPLRAQQPAGPPRPAAPRDSVRRRPDTTAVAIPARADTVPADPDSARRAPRVRADTIKRPLTRSESPTANDPDTYWRWDRASIYSSGAYDLLDLLERVPGLTGFRAAWVGSPGAAAYLGDGSRVRLFYDGIELDPLDPRTGGVVDPVTAQLWTLEELVIERSAGEVRVHMRSWRVDRTAPSTRTDIGTGDLATNTFRGYFGRRFGGGEALQAGFQQFSTSRLRNGGDNDALELMARVGVARGRWSADAYVNRARRTRSDVERVDPLTLQQVDELLPGEEATYTTAYVRGGFGDPGAGLWAQAIAASLAFDESTDNRAAAPGTLADSADTTRSRSQYVLAGGYTRGGLALSLTGRGRVVGDGGIGKSLAARASYQRGVLSSTGYVERTSVNGLWRAELTARLTPFNRIALSGSVSQRTYEEDAFVGDEADRSTLAARGEAALRIGQLWLGGGVTARDATPVAALRVFNDSIVPAVDGQATGFLGTARGRLFRGLQLDAYGIVWDERSGYRPRYQSREQLYLQTSLPRRFPSGNFGLLVSVVHDYRSTVLFPFAAGVISTAAEAHSLSGLLEIRIVNAVLSYQARNVLNARNQYVPFLQAPNTTSVYGVRWEFWN
jgi:hypothetical protein